MKLINGDLSLDDKGVIAGNDVDESLSSSSRIALMEPSVINITGLGVFLLDDLINYGCIHFPEMKKNDKLCVIIVCHLPNLLNLEQINSGNGLLI